MIRPSERWELRDCTVVGKSSQEKHCIFVMLDVDRQTTWACTKKTTGSSLVSGGYARMHSEHSSERMHPASLHVTKPFHHSRHAQSVLTIPDTIRMESSRMFCLMLFPKAIFQSQRGLNWTFPIQLRTSPATGSVKEIPGF